MSVKRPGSLAAWRYVTVKCGVISYIRGTQCVSANTLHNDPPFALQPLPLPTTTRLTLSNMDTRPTGVDYFDPQWNWPSWKFNIPLNDLFGNLHDQYNTVPISIQEPIAFHHDVSELCSTASTLSEFHLLLKRRRDQRIEELRQCWEAVSLRIVSWPPSLEGNEASVAERWAAFLHFSREFSFDTLNQFFSLFTHNGPSKPPTLSPPSPGSSSHQSYHLGHSSTSKTSTASIKSRKRRRSSSTGFGDEQDSNTYPQKRRAHYEPCANPHHNGRPRVDEIGTGATTSPRTEKMAASIRTPTKSSSNQPVRRSSRIAASTQGRGNRQKVEHWTKETLQVAKSRRPRQLAPIKRRSLRKAGA